MADLMTRGRDFTRTTSSGLRWARSHLAERLRTVEPALDRHRTVWNFVAVQLLLIVAALTVVNVGMRLQLDAGVTTGYAMATVLLPLWFGAAFRYRYFPALLVLSGAAVISGYLLTAAHASAYEIRWSGVTASTAMLLGLMFSVGVLLWVRPVMAEWQIGLLFGLGMLTVAASASLSGSSNPWKHVWSLAATVLALSLAHAFRSRILGLVVMLGLAVVSAINDSRSFAAVLVMAAALVAAQMLPWPASVLRLGTVRMVLLLAIVGRLTYTVFSELALNGILGESTKLRTEQQLFRAGSVILGGRPEAAATIGLFRYHPEGFGAGTVLDPAGIAVAQQAMSRVNYDSDNGYVYNYMFGRSIELHSGIGDLWAHFGLPGLLLALVITWALLDSLSRLLSMQRATPLQTFITLLTLWNMLFGPLYSMVPMLVLALGICLVPRGNPTFLGIAGSRSMTSHGVRRHTTAGTLS